MRIEDSSYHRTSFPFRFPFRIFKVNERTVMAAGGDYADYQFLHDVVPQRGIDEECLDDGISYTPKVDLKSPR